MLSIKISGTEISTQEAEDLKEFQELQQKTGYGFWICLSYLHFRFGASVSGNMS